MAFTLTNSADMIRIGILGGAGYTGGELLRLLINHPEADIRFTHSESQAGREVWQVHEGLIGDTSLRFAEEWRADDIDVLFFCFGHGKSREFLSQHSIPEHVRIIDLAQDFRIASPEHDYVYGLPELNREAISTARHIANPGCFATCIQLGLLPLARHGLLNPEVVVNALTGSTGAGQKPSATTHYSWRTDNVSVYKAFTHQHLAEIRQSMTQAQGCAPAEITFIPLRGSFARGIFATEVIHTTTPLSEIEDYYHESYDKEPFTHYCSQPIDMKQVVNTNKALVHCEKDGDRLLVTACIDNLLKGAVGQAVQNMNIMFGLDETTGLRLKPSAF